MREHYRATLASAAPSELNAALGVRIFLPPSFFPASLSRSFSRPPPSPSPSPSPNFGALRLNLRAARRRAAGDFSFSFPFPADEDEDRDDDAPWAGGARAAPDAADAICGDGSTCVYELALRSRGVPLPLPCIE